MFYTYSYHKTRAAAEYALETYFADDTVCDGEFPRVRFERGWWLVEFYDASYPIFENAYSY